MVNYDHDHDHDHDHEHSYLTLEDIPEDYRDKKPVRITVHGNHWHLFYEDGNEIGVHGDPATHIRM